MSVESQLAPNMMPGTCLEDVPIGSECAVCPVDIPHAANVSRGFHDGADSIRLDANRLNYIPFRGRRQWPQARKSADPGGHGGVWGSGRYAVKL